MLSSPRGIGILAPAPRSCPRCDQRAGGRRTRRTPQPPTHTSNPQGTNAARHPCRKFSVLLTLYFISAAAPVEGGRVGNQWAAAVPPPSELRKIGTAGSRAPTSDHPRGGRRQRPPPGQPPPLRRDGPIQTRQLRRDATALPHRTSRACVGMSGTGPRRYFPATPERASRGDSRPLTHAPPWVPSSPARSLARSSSLELVSARRTGRVREVRRLRRATETSDGRLRRATSDAPRPLCVPAPPGVVLLGTCTRLEFRSRAAPGAAPPVRGSLDH